MTRQEFSDTFTTMLNSYNTQANFGEQASKREIVLDEYEKSVLLTQAQDLIVKSYFDGTLNQQGQGFDDSTRRQMDFSSLIRVAELEVSDEGTLFDDRGVMFKLPRKVVNGQVQQDTTDVLFILNERLMAQETVASAIAEYWTVDVNETVYTSEPTITHVEASGDDPEYWTINSEATQYETEPIVTDHEAVSAVKTKKDFVIVPISYKEYDREMSKPYAQPLKKQAWRLFQNSAVGFDINSELIPRFNIVQSVADDDHAGDTKGDVVFIYKIRYVKRPRPIILESLPNGLEIDGESNESDCELNPIVHMDILNKAVELALATRGGGSFPAAINKATVDNNQR